jgi:hypothetical protein
MKLICFALLVSMLPCWARLGETPQQFVDRYGDARKISEIDRVSTLNFTQGEFGILVVFLDGVSVLEIYQKQAGYVSEDEAKEIISKENDGTQWSDEKKNDDGKFWSRPDGAFALLSDSGLTVTSKNSQVAIDLENAAKAKASTKGL